MKAVCLGVVWRIRGVSIITSSVLAEDARSNAERFNIAQTAATRHADCNSSARQPSAEAQVGQHGHLPGFSVNRKYPLQQSNTERHFQPRQGRNRCRNRPRRILSPVRGDILRTMPLLRSLGFHFGRNSTRISRLRRRRPNMATAATGRGDCNRSAIPPVQRIRRIHGTLAFNW